MYQVRQYAVAATAQSFAAPVLESKVLSNKVTVAAYDNNSPVAHVSIVFRYLNISPIIYTN